MAEAHRPEHVYGEKERIARLSRIREVILGAQDGLLVPLGVVSTMAGAFSDNHIVIIAGIAEALAGAFSMATGGYLAFQAEHQVQRSAMASERRAIKKYPSDEKEEMALLLKREGVGKADAQAIADRLWAHQPSFYKTMVEKELGLDPDQPSTAGGSAGIIGVSYLLAALVPLWPYFFWHGEVAIIISICATLVALFFMGVLKGKFATLPYLRSGAQVMLVGAASGLGGYLLGVFLPRLFGLK